MKYSSPNPFFGPKLKIERANEHIVALQKIIDSAVDANSNFFVKTDVDGSVGCTLNIVFPRHTPTILGDAIHNLRAALDHLFCVLIDLNGQVPGKFSSFPIRTTKDEVVSFLRGQEKVHCCPSNFVCTLIKEAIQPYSGGKSGLYDLHLLDVTDKHSLLIPVTGFLHFPNITFHNTAGPTGGGFTNVGFSASYSEYGVRPVIIAGMTHAVAEGENRPTFDILFADGQPLQQKSVVPALKKLCTAVDSAVDLLADAVL
jgi:hypothetical protein